MKEGQETIITYFFLKELSTQTIKGVALHLVTRLGRWIETWHYHMMCLNLIIIKCWKAKIFVPCYIAIFYLSWVILFCNYCQGKFWNISQNGRI